MDYSTIAIFKISTLLVLLFFGNSKQNEIYNYNNHAYSLSSDKISDGYYLKSRCGSSWYPIDITDENENTAIGSTLRYDHFIGIVNDYWWSWDFKWQSYHTSQELTYTNWKHYPGYWDEYAKIEAVSSKWYSILWSDGYYICEQDAISANGINITSKKLINVQPEYVLTYRRHTYYIYRATRDYGTVRRICHNDHNGYLFIPNDGEENCAFHEYLLDDGFVGITNNKNTFTTEKQYVARYLPWSDNNPTSEECVVRSKLNGEFQSSDCNEIMSYFVCETDEIYDNPKYVFCNSTYRKYYFSQVFTFNHSTYYIFDVDVLYADAKDICDYREAIIYVPRNSMENCIFSENVDYSIQLNYGEYFVKGILSPNDLIYSNYTNWDDGYPIESDNKKCVYQNFKRGRWTNDECNPSKFACIKKANKNVQTNAISDCKNHKYLKQEFRKNINIGKYSFYIYAKPMTFYEAHHLCIHQNKTLITPISSTIVNSILNEILFKGIFINHRLMWNDTTILWNDGATPMTPNWGVDQPSHLDEKLACIVILMNGTWKTEYCNKYNIPVCYTTNESYQTTSQPSTNYTNSSQSKSSINKTAIGVGLFFGILAVLGVSLALYIRYRGKFPSFKPFESFGSFKMKRRSFSVH